jgi:hypothetical protein
MYTNLCKKKFFCAFVDKHGLSRDKIRALGIEYYNSIYEARINKQKFLVPPFFSSQHQSLEYDFFSLSRMHRRAVCYFFKEEEKPNTHGTTKKT